MNRKKIFGFIAVLAIAALAAMYIHVNDSRTGNLSDISLANVEALADDCEIEIEDTSANPDGGSGNGYVCWETISAKPGGGTIAQ
jgi:hypothetical protein